MEARPRMRHIGRFLLVTLVRGVLFLVPIVLIGVLARRGTRYSVASSRRLRDCSRRIGSSAS